MMNQSNNHKKNRNQIEKIIAFTVHSNAKYKCFTCDKSFTAITSYRKHRQMHFSEKAVFKCKKCFRENSKPNTALLIQSTTSNNKDDETPKQKKQIRRRLQPVLPKSQIIREFARYESSTDDSDLE